MGPETGSASGAATSRAEKADGEPDGGAATQVADALRRFVADVGPTLALPGSGATWSRFETLARWSSRDLSVGRLVEGHADALAILAEVARAPIGAPSLYGVWAARSAAARVHAERVPGGWRLEGRKEFCSGAAHCDRALVTAETADGTVLFDLSVAEQVTARVPGSWPAVGMAASDSATLEFGGPPVPDDRRVGPPGSYVGRCGFYFGAVGVAACWYGGALGMVADVAAMLPADLSDLAAAELGRAGARTDAMAAVLRRAAEDIDADPVDAAGGAHRRALSVRQMVHDTCVEVLALCASAGGARPLSHHVGSARRAADLHVYLSQHHGPADAAELGRLVRARQR